MISSLFQASPLPDSAASLRVHPADSAVGAQLAPDKVTPLIQFFFQKAPWVMWGGVVIALVILFFLLRWFWPNRRQVALWITTRSSVVKVGLMAAAVAALGIAASAGYTGYHFVETDKRFCNGCHIFVASGQRWVQPDTGNYTLVPRLEGKHDSISCHTCHPLKPMKEAVKLIFWMSGVRGKEIPPHGRVPRKTCEACHVQGAAKETWQAIASTAGHRTHLESDSAALKGKVECLTCHARTAHRFLPADSTCVQKGCHLTDDSKIKLGKMADQTELHCTVCHKFAKPVPALATRDSAAGALRPDLKQCLSCHQMEGLVPNFSASHDPHGGTCGMCHNPHTQINKGETQKSCTDAACHANWRRDPFHTGAAHGKKAEQCILCHLPHAARVDASDCAGCHEAVRKRNPGGRIRPPLPFDTLKALRSSSVPLPPPLDPGRRRWKRDAAPGDHSPKTRLLVRTVGFRNDAREELNRESLRQVLAALSPVVRSGRPRKEKGDAPPGDDPPRRTLSAFPLPPSDTFPHSRHKKLACLTCHLSKTGEKLTFEPPRGCQICHHQAPDTTDCTHCHVKSELPMGLEVEVSIAAAGKPARERAVVFRHEKHADLKCTGCHSERVTLLPADSVKTCQACHDKHHEAGRECSWCHKSPVITQVHSLPVRVHTACDACHPTAAIAPLTPTRSFCLACHDPVVDHHPERECSSCHLQAPPEEYRAHLLKRAPTG